VEPPRSSVDANLFTISGQCGVYPEAVSCTSMDKGSGKDKFAVCTGCVSGKNKNTPCSKYKWDGEKCFPCFAGDDIDSCKYSGPRDCCNHNNCGGGTGAGTGAGAGDAGAGAGAGAGGGGGAGAGAGAGAGGAGAGGSTTPESIQNLQNQIRLAQLDINRGTIFSSQSMANIQSTRKDLNIKLQDLRDKQRKLIAQELIIRRNEEDHFISEQMKKKRTSLVLILSIVVSIIVVSIAAWAFFR